jgi:phage-related minor tail protein
MDQLDSLVIGIRADTGGFAKDVAAIQSQLEGPLATSATKAGTAIDSALTKAITGGKLNFTDLENVAVTAFTQIAASAAKTDLAGLFGGSSDGSGGGLIGSLAGALTSLFGGAPGRATGGPVTGGQAYMVGERGPELFVPTAAGRITPAGGTAGGGVNVTVNVATPADASASFMQRTGAQIARQVRQALDRADG